MGMMAKRDTDYGRLFKLSPAMLDVILHYYTTRTDFPGAVRGIGRDISSAHRDAVNWAVEYELLKKCEDVSVDVAWTISDRGIAFVSILLSTPLPIMSWADPRTGKAAVLEP